MKRGDGEEAFKKEDGNPRPVARGGGGEVVKLGDKDFRLSEIRMGFLPSKNPGYITEKH